MAATQALSHPREPFVIPIQDARPPNWVGELHGLAATTPAEAARDALTIRLAAGDSFSRIEVSFGDVPAMDILTFQQTVAEAYRSIFDLLGRLPTPYPVRFWAFIPEIHAHMGAGLDRYMAFNAGRFAAYSARYGGDGAGRATREPPAGAGVQLLAPLRPTAALLRPCHSHRRRRWPGATTARRGHGEHPW